MLEVELFTTKPSRRPDHRGDVVQKLGVEVSADVFLVPWFRDAPLFAAIQLSFLLKPKMNSLALAIAKELNNPTRSRIRLFRRHI